MVLIDSHSKKWLKNKTAATADEILNSMQSMCYNKATIDKTGGTQETVEAFNWVIDNETMNDLEFQHLINLPK